VDYRSLLAQVMTAFDKFYTASTGRHAMGFVAGNAQRGGRRQKSCCKILSIGI
jgi:hypothetical protein